MASYRCTRCVWAPRFDLETEFICLFFFKLFLFTSAFCSSHSDLVQPADIFNPPGVDAWCIQCTLTVCFFSILATWWVKYTCKQRWRTVCKRLSLKCRSVWLSRKEMKNLSQPCLPTANLWWRMTKASPDICSVDTAAGAPHNYIHDSNLLMESCELNNNVAACVFPAR